MDIVERYRTLTRHRIAVPPDESASAFGLETRWRNLYVSAIEFNSPLIV
jgi:hypothetical protein